MQRGYGLLSGLRLDMLESINRRLPNSKSLTHQVDDVDEYHVFLTWGAAALKHLSAQSTIPRATVPGQGHASPPTTHRLVLCGGHWPAPRNPKRKLLTFLSGQTALQDLEIEFFYHLDCEGGLWTPCSSRSPCVVKTFTGVPVAHYEELSSR